MKIVIVKVALGQILFRAIQWSPLSISPSVPHGHLELLLPREWARPGKLSETGEHYI